MACESGRRFALMGNHLDTVFLSDNTAAVVLSDNTDFLIAGDGARVAGRAAAARSHLQTHHRRECSIPRVRPTLLGDNTDILASHVSLTCSLSLQCALPPGSGTSLCQVPLG